MRTKYSEVCSISIALTVPEIRSGWFLRVVKKLANILGVSSIVSFVSFCHFLSLYFVFGEGFLGSKFTYHRYVGIDVMFSMAYGFEILSSDFFLNP